MENWYATKQNITSAAIEFKQLISLFLQTSLCRGKITAKSRFSVPVFLFPQNSKTLGPLFW